MKKVLFAFLLLAARCFALTATGPATLDGFVGEGIQTADQATGCEGVCSWSVSKGNLPNGLVLSRNGWITGTLSNPGTFDYTLTATDQTGAKTSVSTRFDVALTRAERVMHATAYGAEVASCLASAADGLSTAAAIAAGGREANPIFAGHGPGDISYPKLIVYKSIMCALPIAAQLGIHWYNGERASSDAVGTGSSLSAVAVFTWATFHNLGVLHDLRKEQGK